MGVTGVSGRVEEATLVKTTVEWRHLFLQLLHGGEELGEGLVASASVHKARDVARLGGSGGRAWACFTIVRRRLLVGLLQGLDSGATALTPKVISIQFSLNLPPQEDTTIVRASIFSNLIRRHF